MKIAPKAPVIIISSNVVVIEAGVTVYNPANAYAINTTVQVNGTTNKKYTSTQAVPIGVSPASDINPKTGYGLYWFDIGATNYAQAFDELNSTSCKNANTINYKFAVSDIDTFMMQGLKAKTVRIKMVNVDTAAVLLDETVETISRTVVDWSDWTYEPFEYQTMFYKKLPLCFNATLEITLDNTGSNAETSHIAYGRSKDYGLSLIAPAPVSSRRGISTKARNEFGEIVTRKKARYRRMTITCSIASSSIDIIEDRLEEIVDTACIFIGDDRDGGYKALLIYGEMSDHDMPISVSRTTYQLEVEGYI